MKTAVTSVTCTKGKMDGVRLGLLLGLAALSYAGDAAASGSCPAGMWASHGSCCELGNEYVASKNQCMPVRPERRCVEGHLDDCVVAGRQLEQRGSIGAGYASELYKYACDEGHAPACRGLGGLHERGLGVEKKDELRARELYTQACEGGDAPACTLLAERMIQESSKETKALALFAQACHRGDPYACAEYGQQLARRPEQSKQAAPYLERACAGGVGESCRALLERERDGRSSVDPSRMRELLERGCRAHDAESCVQLGDGLHGGSLAPQNSSQAAARYSTACEAGHLSGCVRLAELTALGDGVVKDLGRASELFTKACGAGVQVACERAAKVEEEQKHKAPVAQH